MVATHRGTLVPGAPESSITRPSTQYVGERTRSAALEAVDQHALHLSHAQPPLAVMLVLTQFSVGAFVQGISLQIPLWPRFLVS